VKQGKKPAFTSKFIITISVIYSSLIIGVAVFFNHVVVENNRIIQDTLIERSNDVFLGKTSTLTTGILLQKPENVRELNAAVREVCKNDSGVLHVLVFHRTGDENYFRLTDSIPVNSHLVMDIKKGDIVQEPSGIDYLKEGRIHAVIDPQVYTKEQYTWQSTYHPLALKNKKYILQYIISSDLQNIIHDAYSRANAASYRSLVIMTGVLVMAVIILTALFFQNYSYLVKRLAEYMQMAAGGNLDINLHPTGDSELNELALSFNTLIEEIRDIRAKKDSMEKQMADSDSDDQTVKTIFNRGVASLKENMYDEAISLFKTLLIIKSGNFGCYFNLGVAFAKTRRYEESLEMFQKAKEVNPSYAVTDGYIERVEKILSGDASFRKN
jgi:hypothetical protein